MAVMKLHVTYSLEIIDGNVDNKIRDIAVRHHEKLNGTGYPFGLSEKDLTLQQRILAVADIASALTGKRSYKERFPKEKVTAILNEMADSNQICKEVVKKLIDNYDYVINSSDKVADEISRKYKLLSDEYYNLQPIISKYN